MDTNLMAFIKRQIQSVYWGRMSSINARQTAIPVGQGINCSTAAALKEGIAIMATFQEDLLSYECEYLSEEGDWLSFTAKVNPYQGE